MRDNQSRELRVMEQSYTFSHLVSEGERYSCSGKKMSFYTS